MPLYLHIAFRDLGIRWPLHDNYDVEVWTAGHECVAVLSGRIIRHLVEQHLAAAALQHEIVTMVRPPLAKAGFTEARRLELRALRRRRAPN